MKLTIPVVTLFIDGGDGSWNTKIYNNEKELIEGYRKYKGKQSLSQKEIDDFINEDDPHGNGYVGKDTIELECDRDDLASICDAMIHEQPVTLNGLFKLSKSVSFHFGQ